MRAMLSLAAARLNLRVGAVLFRPRWGLHSAAQRKERAYDIVRRVQQPPPAAAQFKPGAGVDAWELRSRAMVFVVSGFLAQFQTSLAATARRRDLRAIRVTDPSVEPPPAPPGGSYAGRRTARRSWWTPRAFGPADRAIERRDLLSRTLFRHRIQALALSTQGDYLQDIQDHFDPCRYR